MNYLININRVNFCLNIGNFCVGRNLLPGLGWCLAVGCVESTKLTWTNFYFQFVQWETSDVSAWQNSDHHGPTTGQEMPGGEENIPGVAGYEEISDQSWEGQRSRVGEETYKEL